MVEGEDEVVFASDLDRQLDLHLEGEEEEARYK